MNVHRSQRSDTKCRKVAEQFERVKCLKRRTFEVRKRCQRMVSIQTFDRVIDSS